MRPPFAERAKAATARSISLASRTSTGRNSTPNDGAAVWIAPHWPIPEAMVASRMTAARVTCGAISLSSSNHFAPMPYSYSIKPVTLPPGRARLSTKPAPTGSGVCVNTIGIARVACSNDGTTAPPPARIMSGASGQFRRVSANALGIACGPAIVDLHVAAVGPAQFLQPLHERRQACLSFRIVCGEGHEHADTPHPLALLRAHRERPRRRAAEQRDELATLHLRGHSMTSSARASSIGGTSSPSALAVLRLMTSSYFVGACTGRSAGFSPFRMRST